MKEYWIGFDSKKPDAIVCTTKSRLANFFSVSAKTIDRWIEAGECTEGRYIFRKPINKVHNTWSKFVIDGTKMH